jgi:O-antigen ligase
MLQGTNISTGFFTFFFASSYNPAGAWPRFFASLLRFFATMFRFFVVAASKRIYSKVHAQLHDSVDVA